MKSCTFEDRGPLISRKAGWGSGRILLIGVCLVALIQGAIARNAETQVVLPQPMQTPAPPETELEPPDSEDITGIEEQQKAQTIRADLQENDRLSDYIKLLTKKVQANLVYPDNGRRSATATVSFNILSSGRIRPGSLKIAVSSGQTALDASTLKTIRASAPFDPPPGEITLAITVDFTRKRHFGSPKHNRAKLVASLAFPTKSKPVPVVRPGQ